METRRHASIAGGVFVLSLLLSRSTVNGQTWVAQAPGPNTLGQVEKIDEGEVVGAINAIAVHPTNADIAYIGAVNGGIWRTANAMARAPVWSSQTDGQRSLSIGALEFDPTDATSSTLVAGTGCFSSFRECGSARSGLLRTTDGGSLWTLIEGGGELDDLNISGVAPRGSTIVISVSARSGPGRQGVWRSTNTGVTWHRISGGRGTRLPAGASSDLASDPLNPNRLFTNAGSAGLYRSTDAGATWAKVSSTAMANLMAGAENVRISVGSSNNVYVAIVARGQLQGIFRSGNGGSSWAAMDIPKTIESGGISRGIHPGGGGGIHLSIAADRNNPQVVYVGGDRQPCFVEQFRCDPQNIPPPWPNSIGAEDFSGRLFRGDASRPIGTQWVRLTHSKAPGDTGAGTANGSAPHADSRDMAQAASGDLIEVDDGGVYKRTSPRTNAGDWFSMNGNIQATEFHAVAWDANADVVIGATQDIGTPEQRIRSGVRWRSVDTGDGGTVAVDDTSTPGRSTRYSSAQLLQNFRRQVFDAANVLQSEDILKPRVLGRGDPLEAQFYTPIKLNTLTPTRLILGAKNGVYESFDQGDTVIEIVPPVKVNETGPDIIAYGAAGNPDVLYVGSENQVFVRTAASPAPLVRSAAYQGGSVNGIALDPNDPQRAYVIDSSRVYRTTDSGRVWQDITGNLPTLDPGLLRTVVFTINLAAGAIVVGADSGTFTPTDATSSNWNRLGTGLPAAPVTHLEYDSTDRVLLAGTLGRGAWTLTLPSPSPQPTAGLGAATPARALGIETRDQKEPGEPATGERPVGGDTVVQLRPGVVVDTAQRRAFIMSPDGGIDAVSLTTGEVVWSTKAASRPLGLVDQRLIGQGDPAGAESRFEIVMLDARTGGKAIQRLGAFPKEVVASARAFGGDLTAVAHTVEGNTIVSWEFQEQPLQGIRPGTGSRLAPAKGRTPSPAPPVPEKRIRSGAFLLNLSTGATSTVDGPGPGADRLQEMPRPLLIAEERLPGLPELQVLSADGRHVQVSRKINDDREWDKYILAIYDRRTGERVGELKSHLSHVPFLVTDSTVIYETPAFLRQTEGSLVTEPLKIRTVDLKTGRELWSREVRDTTYRGTLPP